MTHLLSWRQSQKKGKHITFGNLNISYKCTDPKCCSSFQSSYFKVVPERFLPLPLPVVDMNNGIDKYDKEATCLSLYQNIFLQNALMPAQATKKFPKGIPYDYSCSSVDQDMINEQMRSHCGLYFSSLKAKSLQGASSRVTQVRMERVRPLRVAACWQR